MPNAYTFSRIRRIVRRFGLHPLSAKSVASFYRKNAVVRIRTESGTYAMKPFIRSNLLRSSTVDQMKSIAYNIQFLTNNGFAAIPKWLQSSSGKLWTLDQGRPFYVTEWISGKSMENPEDFEKLGRALASLHAISSRSVPANGAFYDLIGFWKGLDRLFRRRMAETSRTNRTHRRWYRKFGESCNGLSDRSWTELSNPEIAELLERERASPALIHSDITSQNVLIADNGQLFLIDWDRLKPGFSYADVATALMNTTRFRPEFIQSLLDGYEEVRPLTRAERLVIASLYRLPREAWLAVRYSHRPRSGSLLKTVEQTWPHRAKAMAFLEEWANRQEDTPAIELQP
ncbi:aminoglycoside phosphotransferase family protein [Cohnella sp. REN36]|uniref:aminoglycoside phosphotransferase family protein n=1 Tax=Cohnella sp. REN36 TaxID=2887347 RepID=UPI001D146068|nr:aminoglycoside phosphotransferase family protein [Cohnella sp. REN36]MCC3376306.1 aminoglycoside phosphotransferase family protein [Cohnella sp. REN36]